MNTLQHDLGAPHDIPQDLVEIRQDEAITVMEALTITNTIPFSIGKSTLQRWAKHWADSGSTSPVKCVLVTNRDGASYRLSRSDFEAWTIEQSQNKRPPEIPQDLVKSPETSQDLTRPQQISRDPARPHETSARGATDAQAETLRAQILQLEEAKQKLEDDNMQLKIDVGVRRELINRAREEMTGLRSMANQLLRENGALGFQIAQLGAPAPRVGIDAPNVSSNTPPPSSGSEQRETQQGSRLSPDSGVTDPSERAPEL